MCAVAVRNCTQCDAKMVAIPNDQIVNANLIVRGAAKCVYFGFAHECQSGGTSRIFFSSMLTPILCNTVLRFIIISNCMKNIINLVQVNNDNLHHLWGCTHTRKKWSMWNLYFGLTFIHFHISACITGICPCICVCA